MSVARADEQTIYEAIGEAGFTDLVGRFYAKMRRDDLVGRMYPDDDWEGSEWRLRMFLIQRFGGPTNYSQQRGHPRLRARHAPFPVDKAAAGRWLLLMREALEESVAAGSVTPEAAQALWPYFADTAAFMINQQTDEPGRFAGGTPGGGRQ